MGSAFQEVDIHKMNLKEVDGLPDVEFRQKKIILSPEIYNDEVVVHDLRQVTSDEAPKPVSVNIAVETINDEPDSNNEGVILQEIKKISTTGQIDNMEPDINITMRELFTLTPHLAERFFCQKEEVFDKALVYCKNKITSTDGDLLDLWLISIVDHWDLEHETIVFLCQNALICFQYDFINSKLMQTTKYCLSIIKSIAYGDFKYPGWSISSKRKQGGVKLSLLGNPPTFTQWWNPFYKGAHELILSSHPLIYAEAHKKESKYNVVSFTKALWNYISKIEERNAGLHLVKSSIPVLSYAGGHAAIFNQSYAGFNLDRNGISF